MKQQSKEKSAGNVNSVGIFFLFLLCLGLSCLGGWELIMRWERIIDSRFETPHLALVLLLIVEYVTISLTAICLVAFFRGGFSRLKRLAKNGLITWLFTALIAKFTTGLTVGFIVGLTAGPIAGLIAGFAVGLIIWLIAGLIAEFK